MSQIIIPYKPRSQFIAYHKRTERFAVLVCHRRAGKTVSALNDLIKRAMTCDKPEPRFAYVAPYYAQAKDVAWSYLQRFTAPIPKVSYNVSELRVDLPNGARIRLYGAENADRLRGIYLDGVVIDEPADISPRVFPEIIRPALSDRKGWATFIGTPKGHNAFYDIYQAAQDDPEWFHMLLRASESGLVNEEELEAARRSMSEDQYSQEFECSFEAAIVGAYYGSQMALLESSGQITSVPHDPALSVDVWFDLGYNDATSMWFIQSERSGLRHRAIRHYQASGESIAHYAGVLNEWKAKGYSYGRIVMPHDAKAKDLRTGKSIAEIMEGYGIAVEVLPRTDDLIRDIELTRSILPKVWFDRENCKDGIEALKQYRKQWDDKRKAFQNHPYHDWTSNPADAFRQFAVGHKTESPPIKFNLPSLSIA